MIRNETGDYPLRNGPTPGARLAAHWSGHLVFGLLCLLVLPVATAEPPVPPPTAAAPSTDTQNPVTILIKDFSFSPRTVTVTAGSTVTWKNADEEPHTVRSDSDLVRSSALDQGDTYSVKFEKPGTYRYGCSIHPTMSGTVIVR